MESTNLFCTIHVQARAQQLLMERYDALCSSFGTLAADATATLDQIDACHALIGKVAGKRESPDRRRQLNKGEVCLEAGDEEEWEAVPAPGIGGPLHVIIGWKM